MVSPGEGGFWKMGVDAGIFDEQKMTNPWVYGSKMAPFDEEVSFVEHTKSFTGLSCSSLDSSSSSSMLLLEALMASSPMTQSTKAVLLVPGL